jgi:hypothetical protein
MLLYGPVKVVADHGCDHVQMLCQSQPRALSR